jgi:hypothetical protein
VFHGVEGALVTMVWMALCIGGGGEVGWISVWVLRIFRSLGLIWGTLLIAGGPLVTLQSLCGLVARLLTRVALVFSVLSVAAAFFDK